MTSSQGAAWQHGQEKEKERWQALRRAQCLVSPSEKCTAVSHARHIQEMQGEALLVSNGHKYHKNLFLPSSLAYTVKSLRMLKCAKVRMFLEYKTAGFPYLASCFAAVSGPLLFSNKSLSCSVQPPRIIAPAVGRPDQARCARALLAAAPAVLCLPTT